MIELFSNFYLTNNSSGINFQFDNPIVIYLDNVNINESLMKNTLEYWKQLKTIVIVYNDTSNIKYFLSLFTYHICKIRKKTEFEDILLINRCIFLQ